MTSTLVRLFSRTMASPSGPLRAAFLHHAAPTLPSASSFARVAPAVLVRPRLSWPRVPRRGYACVASPSLSARDNGVLRDDPAAADLPLAPDVGFAEPEITDPELHALADEALAFDGDLPSVVAPSEEKVAPVPEKRKKNAPIEIKDGMGPPIESFRLSPETVARLAKNGISNTTEVQAGTFDLLFDVKDMIAKSRTGTGKTLAFALPIMERLAIIRNERGGHKPRGEGSGCIVLAPTRELAKQVAREMTYLGEGLNLSVECFYGGVSYGPQEGALRRGVDVVVGTPRRIIDHLERGELRLDNVSFAVLDEDDEMLSMGFSQDVETMFETLPPQSKRKLILFSATVPGWVKSLAAHLFFRLYISVHLTRSLSQNLLINSAALCFCPQLDH